jgi:thiamine kinase-like enzyme
MNGLLPEDLVRALPIWQGPVMLEVLKGGVSNVSFRVSDQSGQYIARVGRDYPFHLVFRDAEVTASRAAFDAGLSPEVTYAAPGVMVVRALAARTYAEADVQANAQRCVEIIKRCHREMGRRILGRAGVFWVFQVNRHYARLLQDAGQRHVPDLTQWMAALDETERAQVPLPIVFGHHDLLPGNFLDDGARLWLIDWEYAGFGTAMFDLACMASNNQFTEQHEALLLEQYFERTPNEALLRAFYAMKCAAALREAMWGMVSEIHLPHTGIDYIAYADEYLGRYAAVLASYHERFGTA